MVIVVLITIIHRQDLIITDRKWWLCRDIVHLHEEDIMVEGMVEVEDGKFKKYKLLKVVAYCCDFFAFKTVIFVTT